MNTPARMCAILVTCAFMGTAVAADRASSATEASGLRDRVTMKFRYDARDLATYKGAERVHRKLLLAARRECRTGSLLVELRGVDTRCVVELMDNAVLEARSAHLADVHRGMERIDLAVRR